MTCHFCHREIKWRPGSRRYQHRDYHEPCFEKLRSVARATGGVL